MSDTESAKLQKSKSQAKWYKHTFCNSWLEDFPDWLFKDADGNAGCRPCNAIFKNPNKKALQKHSISNKHKREASLAAREKSTLENEMSKAPVLVITCEKEASNSVKSKLESSSDCRLRAYQTLDMSNDVSGNLTAGEISVDGQANERQRDLTGPVSGKGGLEADTTFPHGETTLEMEGKGKLKLVRMSMGPELIASLLQEVLTSAEYSQVPEVIQGRLKYIASITQLMITHRNIEWACRLHYNLMTKMNQENKSWTDHEYVMDLVRQVTDELEANGIRPDIMGQEEEMEIKSEIEMDHQGDDPDNLLQHLDLSMPEFMGQSALDTSEDMWEKLFKDNSKKNGENPTSMQGRRKRGRKRKLVEAEAVEGSMRENEPLVPESGDFSVGDDDASSDPIGSGEIKPDPAGLDPLDVKDLHSKEEKEDEDYKPPVQRGRKPKIKNAQNTESETSTDDTKKPRKKRKKNTEDSSSESKVVFCSECNKDVVLFGDDTLKKHMRREHPILILCPFCSFSCRTVKQILNHKNKAHPGEEEMKVLCPHCGEVSPTFTQHVSHMTLHLKVQHCDLCPRSFPNTKALRIHRQLEHPEARKVPTIGNPLNNGQAEICPFCGKLIKYLQTHIYHFHTEHKWQKCSLCDYASNVPGAVKSHFKHIHCKPDVCPKCNKTVKILRRHLKRANCGKPMEERRNHPCEYCGKSFTSNAHLKRHIEVVHRKTKMAECPHCSYKTASKFNVDIHIKRVHEGKQLKSECQFCGKQVFSIDYHLKVYHQEELLSSSGVILGNVTEKEMAQDVQV